MIPILFILQVPGPVYLCLAEGSFPPFLSPGSLARAWGHGGEDEIIHFFFFSYFVLISSFERPGRVEPEDLTSSQSPHLIYEERGLRSQAPQDPLCSSGLMFFHTRPVTIFPQLMAGVFLSDLRTTTLIHPWWSSRETKALR